MQSRLQIGSKGSPQQRKGMEVNRTRNRSIFSQNAHNEALDLEIPASTPPMFCRNSCFISGQDALPLPTSNRTFSQWFNAKTAVKRSGLDWKRTRKTVGKQYKNGNLCFLRTSSAVLIQVFLFSETLVSCTSIRTRYLKSIKWDTNVGGCGALSLH